MKFLYFLVFVVLVAGCVPNNILYQRDPKWDLADDAYDNEIGKKVFLQLVKEKKLYVCESGWALHGSDKIRCMHCGFNYYDEINIEKARELLMTAVDLYLKTINENERIRPLLSNYPFTLDNVEILIFLKKSNGSELDPDKLHVLALKEGILEYMIGSLGRELLPTIYHETYEEAKTKFNDFSKIPQNA